MRDLSFFGAGSRGRTDTVLLPSDFESDASANSTIPANGWYNHAVYYNIMFRKNQYVLVKKVFSQRAIVFRLNI